MLSQNVVSSDDAKRIVDQFPPELKIELAHNIVAELSEGKKTDFTQSLVKELPQKKREAIFGELGQTTREKLWKIAVWSFAIVMVGAFLSIAFGAFLDRPDNAVVSGDVLLSIFTAAVGFFAGLFAPSPGSQGG